MLSLYRSLARSVTDYGMEIYFNSNTKNNYDIEKIENEALRLCTGALKSTPVCTLQHACNELHVMNCLHAYVTCNFVYFTARIC